VRRVLLLVGLKLAGRLEILELLLELAAERDHRLVATALLHIFGDLREVLVALTEVVPLAHVDEEHHGLGRQQLKLVENVDFERVPVAKRDVLAGFEPLLDANKSLPLELLLLAANTTLDVLTVGLDELGDTLEILQTQFLLNDLDVTDRVDVAYSNKRYSAPGVLA
jgi:hypothetical protein